jgi:peptidoglycan/LPS O-acetylase OafA/YrhL
VLIVWHHLAFYGPMSDVARPLAPALVDWLYDYARWAVQVFLVVSGFLQARSLGLGRWPAGSPLRWFGRRYLRLVLPYTVALLLAIAVAALARLWMASHPMVPAAPQWPQLAAHVLLLQDLLDMEALSAGVWYVAIDFQLFVLTALLCVAGRALAHRRAPAHRPWEIALVAAAAAASLLWFNRDAQWDDTALYFIGAYGLGVLCGWATRSARPWRGVAAIALLGALALAVDWRGRIALALVTALVLAVLQLEGLPPRWRIPQPLQLLGQASYAVFLLHFPVCMLVTALWSLWWPTQPVWNALGMCVAFALSLLAGLQMHALEQRLTKPRAALGWRVALLAIGLWLIDVASV